jgi:hypothetical protein
VAPHPGLVAGGARQLRDVPEPIGVPVDCDALAQQPPLSNTATAQTSAALPLTLATGFLQLSANPINTFAVDPAFRVGTAHNYQASLQRDLPSSLTVIATYLGSRGTHLMQESLPNSYPIGAVNPCASCPSGFVYLTSNGTSMRNAAQTPVAAPAAERVHGVGAVRPGQGHGQRHRVRRRQPGRLLHCPELARSRRRARAVQL